MTDFTIEWLEHYYDLINNQILKERKRIIMEKEKTALRAPSEDNYEGLTEGLSSGFIWE